MTTETNRETWLSQATDILRQGVFQPAGHDLPELKISVGLPFGRNQRDIKIQYFAPENSADHIGQIYISPLVDNAREAINLLFGQLAVIARYTAAFDDSQAVAEVLGDYPQAAITLPDLKTQATRMLKVQCATCHYTARVTARWLSRGAPLCPCNSVPMQRT